MSQLRKCQPTFGTQSKKTFVVVVNDPNNDLKNYSVGQTAEVTGYLVGHGDQKHGYSWELNVAQ